MDNVRHCDSSLRAAPSLCFFFFQAEDGIRDLIVTGVQTCALPISMCVGVDRGAATVRSGSRAGAAAAPLVPTTASGGCLRGLREDGMSTGNAGTQIGRAHV